MVFCHTLTRISHGYTHVPSLPGLFPPISLPTLPFSLPQSPFEFPEPCSKFPLAICYTHGIVSFYVLLSIHLPISLLPSHRVHRSVPYVCFSTAALKINSSVPSLQILYMCVSIWYLFFITIFNYYLLFYLFVIYYIYYFYYYYKWFPNWSTYLQSFYPKYC